LRAALLALSAAADRYGEQRERGDLNGGGAFRHHRFSPCFFSFL
jgi:hypothetical protein